MTTRRIAVVTAGLSTPSSTRLLADRLAAATRSALGERGEQAEIDIVELRDLAVDIAGNLVSGFPGAPLRRAVDTVTGADGVIAVTPVFTASYSGLFKSFFDILDKESLAGKPVVLAATGGTERHSLVIDHALRPMFAYLRAIPAATGVYAASSDWGNGDALHDRVARAGAELADLIAARPAAASPADELESLPFEELLGGVR